MSVLRKVQHAIVNTLPTVYKICKFSKILIECGNFERIAKFNFCLCVFFQKPCAWIIQYNHHKNPAPLLISSQRLFNI